jgi:hypothetical protein
MSTARASPRFRAAARDSAERRPCRQRALRDCSKPVAVFGPVLAPPCIRHRPAAIAGPLQGRPLRHRAPQRGAAFAASSAVCHGSAPGAQGSLRGIVISPCKGSPGCRDGTCDDRLAAGDADMLHRNNLPTAVPHPQKGQCGALIGLHQPRCHVGHAGGFHQTIRTTPAMAAGVTKRLWEMTDIVDMLEAWEAAE